MINQSRCREKIEGWKGRRRNYLCQECHRSFQADALNPLPEIDRICPGCKDKTHIYVFINKKTGKDTLVRASNIELATLRATAISPNLTFKIPQPSQEEVK